METSLPTRAFGRTVMQITRIGIGACAVGGNMWGRRTTTKASPPSAKQSSSGQLDRHGRGLRQRAFRRSIAEALSAFGPAERPFVLTKGGIIRDADGINPHRHAADIRQQCVASLKRLGVERIDLYQLHWPSEDARGELRRNAAPPGRRVATRVGLSNH